MSVVQPTFVARHAFVPVVELMRTRMLVQQVKRETTFISRRSLVERDTPLRPGVAHMHVLAVSVLAPGVRDGRVLALDERDNVRVGLCLEPRPDSLHAMGVIFL